KKILQISGKGKVKKAKVVEVMGLKEYGALDVDVKVELIQELIPLGLMHIKEELQEEVRRLAGDRYKRDGIVGYDRWGRQQGSVYIKDQRIPITLQRIRDTIGNREVSLSTYERFQQPSRLDEGLLRRVLHGLSCRNYRECSEAIPGALSLSASTVSRRYIRASMRKLRELMDRRLDGYDFIGIVLDGKSFGDDGIIMAVGITIEGKKVLLGLIQAGTENHRVCKDFLLELIERGLRYDRGLLCVIDGAKGLRKAINEVFGTHGMVQRCQWHKRENIVSYLPKGIQARFRQKLQSAYSKGNYEEARSDLNGIRAELKLINESAVKSLDEGFEETLTIQRLGLHKHLGRSFTTTNIIESIMSMIGRKTGRINYWRNSSQKQRWVGAALLWAEQRLNKVNGYRHLIKLREAVQREIGITEGKEVVAA
ncbi:MAG: transposase, partial [Deltaproteobacteria bacterium]